MSTRTEVKPWDFSHVLELNNHFSWKSPSSEDGPPAVATQLQSREYGERVAARDFASPSSQLGDFGKVWQYLGVPVQSSVSTSAASGLEQASRDTLPTKKDYASDGATFVKSRGEKARAVQWLDDTSGGEFSTDAAEPLGDTPSLTKTQRKKLRRKERRAQEAAESIKHGTVSESEADSISKRTPARKASKHIAVSEPGTKATSVVHGKNGHHSKSVLDTPTKSMQAKSVIDPSARIEFGTQNPRPQTSPKTPASKVFDPSTRPSLQPQTVPTKHLAHLPSKTLQTWPVPNAQLASATKLVPSTVQPPANKVLQNQNSQPIYPQSLQTTTQQHSITPSKGPQRTIEPKIVRSGEDRHWALLMKLLGDFFEDRKHLVSPMNLTTHNNDPNGIHVFVDASNIFIGFNEQLKRARGIPLNWHVPPVHLSFDALALLMERRRPVAKRVLVGSTPHVPAFDKAQAVGYETSVLEKVYKARELTERQKFFKALDAGTVRRGAKAPSANTVASASSNGALMSTSPPSSNSYYHNNNGYTSGTGSGSETTAPQYARAKMIEQGVDEILHLKILESIVDSEQPSTMVLATGDAAAAEYSDGFMAMAERALKKGWRVELVSWSKNISAMYRRREWTEAWGERFRIIELDDYAEELLDT